MKFRVSGAHRETGEPFNVTLDASTPSAAEEQANRLSILVESLEVEAPMAVARPAVPAPPQTVYVQQPMVAPSGQPVVMRPAVQVQTIEKTSKSWKGLQLLSVIGIIIFGVGTCARDAVGPSEWMIVGLFTSLCFYILARVGAWWNHG